MVLGIDLVDNAFYHTVFVDDKGGASRAHIGASVEFLLGPHTEGLVERGIGVGNEVKGNDCFSINLRCDASLSLLTPTTS